MEPPWFWTICLQTHRPKPFPIEPLVVKNGSKILGSAATLIPWPLSAIVIRIRELPFEGSRDVEARSVTLPPSPSASMLFNMRFEITCHSSPKFAVMCS